MYGATRAACLCMIRFRFQPTPRMYGATFRCTAVQARPCNFNPRPVCTGRLCRYLGQAAWVAISTHAPYVRGDMHAPVVALGRRQFQPTPRMYGATEVKGITWKEIADFNPRPVCTGRPRGLLHRRAEARFQPTPRMYGATMHPLRRGIGGANFNPRPVCTGRLQPVYGRHARGVISTHAPYVRGDAAAITARQPSWRFQPTPRMYGATTGRWRACRSQTHFNPRPVCTGRPAIRPASNVSERFQPTPRMYGATPTPRPQPERQRISTHAPYVRGDCACGRENRACGDFNPRPVCTGRRPTSCKV